MRRLLVLAVLLFAIPAHAEVTIDWLTVGDPGNAGDTQVMTCCGDSIGTSGYGAVPYEYRIGKYEVTNAQYTEFLNAVADDDTNALYNTSMADVSFSGGITRSGSSPNFSYSAIAGREDMPVNWVSFYDSLRFANWLSNGQPTGTQDSTTTEDGAYDMSLGSSVVRKAGATVFLTSEDEWYKAAYYDTGATSYFDYPAGSDTQTTCTTPGATANTANCSPVVGDLTDVGSYTGAASPNVTFDQGGNVLEWNEAILDGSDRGLRAGAFTGLAGFLAASIRLATSPVGETLDLGFRVASLEPEAAPIIPVLSPAGLLVFAAGLLGFIGYYRRRF